MTAGDLVAVICPDPWSLRFEDGGGRTLLAQQHDDVDVTGTPCSLPFGEQYYGLGERFGTFGQRGTRTWPAPRTPPSRWWSRTRCWSSA